ncbi:MAG: hypothetical protein K8S22_03740, partial [Betaproteobacteria bacterium]|nr:hypothetical protein [Betaproteobacteria bacterium]
MLGGAAAYRGDLVEVFARDLFMMSIHFGQAYDDHMMFYGRAQYGLSAHPLIFERLSGQGAEPAGGTAEQFGAFIRTEIDKWSKLVAAAKMKAD